MKRIFAILCLASFAAWAQVPPPPTPSPYPSAVPVAPANPAGAAGPIPNISTRSIPRVLPPRSTNSIITSLTEGGTNSIAHAVSPAPAPAVVPAAQTGAQPAPAGPTTGPAAISPALAAPGSAPVTITPPPGAAAATAAEEPIPAGTIDFRGAALDDVLKVYSELVNRTILRAATLPVQTQVTLRTQTQLTRKEAIQALDAVLALNQVAMINVGEKFVKAVALPTANTEGQAFSKLDPSQLADLGQYTTHVVQLRYAKPSEMVQALQPFAKAPNPILPIDSSQMLVLRDFTENVKRMLELIKEIDVAVPSEFIQEVIPIKYALASEISSALNSLGSGGGGATVGGGSTTGGATSSRTSSYGRSNSNMGRSGMGMNQGGYGMNPMATTTGAAQPSTFGDRLQQIMRRASVTGDIQVIGSTKIIADERTNSLLIFASREDMKVIKDIISKLDVVLAQVLIEAVIIEVNLGDDRALGLNYLQKPQTAGNFTGVGAINNKAFLKPSDYILGTSTGTNGSSGGLPSGLSYLGSFGQDLDVSLVAIASDNRAKILQRPYIQTSHAVPATLFVGESRPYPMGSYYGGGSYGSYSSIQQIQIGVTLEVTPLINPDGLVVMDIHQKIESANGSVNIANVGDVPVTSQKDAVAKVAVRDRDTIMLGGLIETSKSKTASGVPYLKDIPVLGYLFRSSSSKEIRNEMIVLIRPTVLPTPEIAALTARSEKAKMPGIRRAEAELEKDQADRIRALEREEKAARPTDGANDPRFAPVEGL